MPHYELDLDAFTVVTLDAPTEAQARAAVDAVLSALRRTEYAIGEARHAEGGSEPQSRTGRPPSARRQLARILALRREGLPINAVGRELGISRSSVFRALRWRREQDD